VNGRLNNLNDPVLNVSRPRPDFPTVVGLAASPSLFYVNKEI